MSQPENVKYALVKRQPSAWKQGAKAAAVVAIIQIIFMALDPGPNSGIVAVTIIFGAYWLFFTFVVWLWRVIRGRA